MELKWLEDFLSLARTKSFSRSAEERNITQSALSRRIASYPTMIGIPMSIRMMSGSAIHVCASATRFRIPPLS